MKKDLQLKNARQLFACDQKNRHKVIDLERDKIFERAVPLDENEQYCNPDITVSQKTKDDAFEIMENLLRLAADKKIDATDLKIIEMRDSSPMPSMREVAKTLNLSPDTISQRIGHLKDLIPKALHPKKRK